MKRFLVPFITALTVLCAVPALSVYAWDKPVPAASSAPGPAVNPIYRAPFTFDKNMYAPGKISNGVLPQMGFNTWNAFQNNIDENKIRGIADSFIRLGLDKVGYNYVCIDDGCYATDKSRDANGRLHSSPVTFPSGFKAMADYIHGKGLKFGMYNDVGTLTCDGMCAGTWGNEDLDALTFAQWGVDYVKYDFCNNPWNAAPFISAPNIRSILVTDDSGYSNRLVASSAAFALGLGDKSYPGMSTGSAAKNTTGDGYISGLTCNTGATGTTGDCTVTVNVPAAGTYNLQVEYTGISTANRWLQTDVNGVRVIDGLQPATADASTYVYTAPVKVTLNAGDNAVRLYCEKRREVGMEEYAAFFDGLVKAREATGQNIAYSLCEWGNTQPWLWAWKVGLSWRTTGDITGSADAGTWSGMRNNYNYNVILDQYAGLDKGWNDPDMLMVGVKNTSTTIPATADGRFSFAENETHFNAWCMMNAPLILGCDLRNVETGDDVWKVITNTDAIALNQDPLGIQAKRVKIVAGTTTPNPSLYNSTTSRVDFLAKPLANNDVALMILNLGDATTTTNGTITIDEILNGTSQYHIGVGSEMVNKDAFASADYYELYNIGAKSKTAVVISKDTPISVDLAGHASATFRISPFTAGDDFVTLTREANGDVTADYAVSGAQGYKALLAIAVYDENMVLQSVDRQTVAVDAPFTAGTMTIQAPGLKWTVKAFLWDAASYAPLCPAAVYGMPGADKTALHAYINTAKALSYAAYSRLSADNVVTALAAAQATDAKPNPTQAEIDTAANDLSAALGRLTTDMSLYTRLTGTMYGAAGTYGSGRTYNMIFDGNIATFYDAAAGDTGYGGLDLGAGNEATVDLIRFYPRPDTYYTRANGCTFRGSMTDNAGGNVGTLLYTISGVTSAKWYVAASGDTTDKFRYVWFQSGPGSWGNMSEVEFYTKTGVDRSLLDDRITYANGLSASAYTPGSWSAVQAALAGAASLPANADQAQVDSAAAGLKAALAALVAN